MTVKPRTRIYKNRWFAKFANREGISDAMLVAAIDQASRGLIDADLGGGLTNSVSRAKAEASPVATARWSSSAKRNGPYSPSALQRAIKPTSARPS